MIQLRNGIFLTLILILCVVSCSSIPSERFANQDELLSVYMEDIKSASVDIIFDRGHNSHRIYATNKSSSPEIFVFHDRQVYKSLKIDELKFKELLSKSLQTAGTLHRKPAIKESSPCRTPFQITVKNNRETFSVEGCRSAEEAGGVFGKFIAEIEYLTSSPAVH
jgi:hypothetical protein